MEELYSLHREPKSDSIFNIPLFLNNSSWHPTMGSSSAAGGMKSRNGGGRNRGRQLGEGGNTTHRANNQEERYVMRVRSARQVVLGGSCWNQLEL